MNADTRKLRDAIIDNGWMREGDFTLSSGKKSSVYIDLRPCMLNSSTLHLVTTGLVSTLANNIRLNKGDLLCGVVTSGLFLAGALTQRLETAWTTTSAIYVRTNHRTHGAKVDIEGVYKPGQWVIIVDDVSTTGRSFGEVIERLNKHNLRVKACLSIVDREEGCREYLESMDVPLYSLLTLSDLRG